MTSSSPEVGVLMLNTQFPRLPGDIGLAGSFDCQVIHQVVESAVVENVVTPSGVDEIIARAFVGAAVELQSKGVKTIATSCGFLSVLQDRIQAAVSVPFVSSALLLIPMLKAQYGEAAKLGVMTFDAEKLNHHHVPLLQAQIEQTVYCAGLQKSDELYRVISQDLPILDEQKAGEEVMSCLQRLLLAQPDVKAIVLECTNLSHWKQEMYRACGLPVLDLVDLVHMYVGSQRGCCNQV